MSTEHKGGRMRIITTMLLLAVAVGTRPASATSGTCTITNMQQTGVGEVDFGFPIPNANGVAMGVEVDEAAGTISMSRDAFYAQFGDTGVSFSTVGVESFVRMKPGSSSGTIESDGTVSFPVFDQTFFATSFGSPSPPYPDLPINDFGLTSGLVAGAVPTARGTKRGTNLDFSTGSVALTGIGIVIGAPGTNGPLLTGIELTCTMSPIPNQASLPAPPTLTKIKGTGKTGTAGDTLIAKLTVGESQIPLDFATAEHSVINLLVAGAADPVVQARIAAFTPKGKKFVATRDDTCKIKKGATQGLCKNDGVTACTGGNDCASTDVVDLLFGQKSGGTVVANVTATPKKKGAVVSMKLAGLDLSALSGAVTVELWVKTRGAIGNATASGTTKKKIK
jgi:hypothetical protein